MKQLIRTAAVLFLTAVLFSACNSVPDHARYIPADALTVVGINTKEMSKEIAWSAITGSKILDNLNKENEKDAAKQLDQAGINWMSTAYVYVRSGGKNASTVIAGVLPLKNKTEWEAFVKKQFPQVTFKTVNDRTDASLDEKIYAGWNDKVLIIMCGIPGAGNQLNSVAAAAAEKAAGADDDTTAAAILDNDSMTGKPGYEPPRITMTPAADMTVLMDSAFALKKDRSIVQDKRFAKLEKQGHDITMWVNYDAMMNLYMGNSMTQAMGMSLSNTLWKGSAMASGLDFRKGKITADMLYYSAEGMKEICKQAGKENADKDMIDRLPMQNLNMVMAWHLSPQALKGTIEKAGMLGLLNLGLMSVGVSSDDIFDTFTGDMAVSVSNFGTNTQTNTAADSSAHTEYTPHGDYVYVMKIAKKENLAKLLGIAVSKELLKPAGKNMYQLPGGSGSPFILANDDNYLVATNKAENALAYLQGKNKGGNLPEVAQKAVYGHPMGAYFDITTLTKTMTPSPGTSPEDLALMEDAKKLLTDISFYSGSFNGTAFESHATANFTNKEENGLLQLLEFAVKAKKLADQHHTNNMAAAPATADTTTAVQ